MKRLSLFATIILCASLGVLVAGCGGGDGAVAVEPTPSGQETPGSGSGKTSGSATASTPTTTVKSAPAAADQEVTFEVWFRRGEGLAPVKRTEVTGVRVGTAALESLLAGPTADEERTGYSTAIPVETRLLGLSIADKVATVDLSSEFEEGDDSEALRARLGQVTCTLTQFPTVDGVVFRLDGERIDVFGRDDIVVDHPVTCEDYEDILPPIAVASPRPGQRITSPVIVGGTANVFEANVNVVILDARGRELARTFTTATCGTGCRGDFFVKVPFEVDREQRGTVIVHDDDAAGTGTPPHQVRIPVILAP